MEERVGGRQDDGRGVDGVAKRPGRGHRHAGRQPQAAENVGREAFQIGRHGNDGPQAVGRQDRTQTVGAFDQCDDDALIGHVFEGVELIEGASRRLVTRHEDRVDGDAERLQAIEAHLNVVEMFLVGRRAGPHDDGLFADLGQFFGQLRYEAVGLHTGECLVWRQRD